MLREIYKPFFILVIIFFVFFLLFWNKNTNFSNELFNCRYAQIGQKTFILERSFTDESRQIGLSNRPFMEENKGMIFEFENKSIYDFWMKEMLFPIDIIFVDNNVVTDIYKSVKPEDFPNTYSNTRPANFVIELNSGETEKIKIKVGEKIKIFNPQKCSI